MWEHSLLMWPCNLRTHASLQLLSSDVPLDTATDCSGQMDTSSIQHLMEAQRQEVSIVWSDNVSCGAFPTDGGDTRFQYCAWDSYRGGAGCRQPDGGQLGVRYLVQRCDSGGVMGRGCVCGEVGCTMSRPPPGVHCGWPYEVSSACPGIFQMLPSIVSSTNTAGARFPVCFSPQSSLSLVSCTANGTQVQCMYVQWHHVA